MMEILAALAGTVHGGALAAFALLLPFRDRLKDLGEIALVRAFRAVGPVLGLSLGVYLLAEAWTWPGVVNPGAVGIDRWAVPADLRGLRVGVLGAYWVSYVALEIWTLEPCRLNDRDGVVKDPVAFVLGAARVTRHLVLNAALFLTQLGLAVAVR